MLVYYSYKAIDAKTGRAIYGKIEAPNEIALEQMLAESDMTLVSAKEIKQSKLASFLSFAGSIKYKDLITMFITLEQLQRAGVPLLDSLKDLKDFTENPKLKQTMQSIYESVKGGDMLSTAMAKHPKIFSEIMISLVAMGEKTGELDKAFKNIYENIKWNMEINKKIKKAVTGPSLSIAMLFGIAAMMLKVVVPKVLGFILDQGIKVPSYTEALIATSNFIEKYFLMIVGMVVGVVAGLMFLLKASRSFRIMFDAFKLKLPLIGSVMQKIELSRFTKFFGITFSSGIPVLDCITIASNVVVNAYIKNEINIIRQKVSDGKSMTKAISESHPFPFMVIRMFKVGEESGNIKTAMENIDYFYEGEINDSIEIVVGSLKPIIMFVMGGFMCWIIAAVFGPIYGNFANMV